MSNVKTAQLFPCPFKAPCEIYGCRKSASWFVGRPDTSLVATFKLCNDCAQSLVDQVPDELKGVEEQSQGSGDIDLGQATISNTGEIKIENVTITEPPTKKKPAKKPVNKVKK